MAKDLAIRREGDTKAVSSAPSYNWTPVGPAKVALPYQVIACLGEAEGCAGTVRFNGAPAFILGRSRIPTCMGDGDGSDKGVRSDTLSGAVWPTLGSPSFLAEGGAVIRGGDPCMMQGGNTVGIFVPPAFSPAQPPDDPYRAADPPVIVGPEEPPGGEEPDPVPSAMGNEGHCQAPVPGQENRRQAAIGEAKGLANVLLEAMEDGLVSLAGSFGGARGWGIDPVFPRFRPGNPVQAQGAKRAAGTSPGLALLGLPRNLAKAAKPPSMKRQASSLGRAEARGPSPEGTAAPTGRLERMAKRIQRKRKLKPDSKTAGQPTVGGPPPPQPDSGGGVRHQMRGGSFLEALELLRSRSEELKRSLQESSKRGVPRSGETCIEDGSKPHVPTRHELECKRVRDVLRSHDLLEQNRENLTDTLESIDSMRQHHHLRRQGRPPVLPPPPRPPAR